MNRKKAKRLSIANLKNGIRLLNGAYDIPLSVMNRRYYQGIAGTQQSKPLSLVQDCF
ncbi:MAG: hypothetical protein KC422_00150 [Trueperaceae bacterium]|nr:hypothetical protein [Trueperaceae bacterium]